VVLNQGCPELQAALGVRGFTTHATLLDEFLKAGGSAKCLTLHAAGTRPAPAVPLMTPIAVDLGPGLPPDGGRFLSDIVPALRDRFFYETGITMPGVRVAPAPGLKPGAYVLRLDEVPMAHGEVVPGGKSAEEVIGDHLHQLLRRYGYEFIGIQETQTLLAGLEKNYPALVQEVVPKLVSPVLLADVLKRLAEEGISLRTLRDILGALAAWAPLERDPVALTEHVRSALRRQITFKYAGSGGTLGVYLLDPMIEDAVREAIQKTATGSYLALEPALARDILLAVGRTIPRAMPGASLAPVVLTGADVRRYVRRLVETEFPHVAVLSYQELVPDVKLQPLGRIAVAGGVQ
jgi:type III secretion protein V